MSDASISIIDAIKDERLIGDTISSQQEVILRAIYGLPLQEGLIKTRVFRGRKLSAQGKFEVIEETPEQFFCRITDRESYVPTNYREAGIYIGARGGKSDKLSSNIAIYEATLRTHRLSRGEKGLIPCVAFDKPQAGIVFSYIKGKLLNSPVLSKLVASDHPGLIELQNSIEIGVYPGSFRQLRGYSVPAAVADEIAIWRDVTTGANPAKEIVRSLRRGMMTFPEAKLAKISSPFAKSGIVWDDWQNRKKRLRALILKVPSWEINPTLSEDDLLAELEDDPELFWREFGAEFWDAVAPLVPIEKVDAAISMGVKERPYNPGHRYFGIVDVAFRQDAFAFGVCHREGDRVVWDLVRSWAGTKDDAVQMDSTMPEIEGVSRKYLISMIHGDQYCAEPIRQALKKAGMEFTEFTFTANSKQQLYANLRSLFMGAAIDIPDDGQTANEIKTLEAVTGSMGMVKVQAAQGFKDDRATVVALGSLVAMQGSRGAESWVQSLRERAEGRGKLDEAAPPGRTKCVDCGKIIPLDTPYRGYAPGMGQCQECEADHGSPTYAAVKPSGGAAKPQLIGVDGLS